MLHRALIIFFAASAIGISSLIAQSAGPVIPSYQVPERLTPYVDEDRIKGSAKAVVELLKSSEFIAISAGLDPECDEEANPSTGVCILHWRASTCLPPNRRSVGRNTRTRLKPHRCERLLTLGVES